MRSKNDFIALIKENEGIIYKVSKSYCNTVEDQKDCLTAMTICCL